MSRMHFYCGTVSVLLVKFLASAGAYVLKSELEESAVIMSHIHILPRHRALCEALCILFTDTIPFLADEPTHGAFVKPLMPVS